MSNAFFRSMAAHVSLLLAIVMDYLRRQQSGDEKYILYAAGVLFLAIPWIFFARQPKAFFFFWNRDGVLLNSRPGVAMRALFWLFVVGFPVAWIILALSLSELVGSELVGRLVGAYSAFFWFAATAILAPYLFGPRQVD